VRTGPDFREVHELEGGTSIVLRHIQPEDAPELRRQFLALSPESRYRRFFGPINDLDERTLEYLTHVDQKDHVAIVATTESLDLKTERGLGVARFVRSKTDPTVAEAAVTVVDDMQRRGIGTLLTKALAVAARERGIDRFRCEVLETNHVVVDALRDLGAEEVDHGIGTVVLDVPIPPDGSTLVQRAIRLVAEHVNAFLRRLLPPLLTPE
jgi:ribosomal protein S18 acetylase RimI-like enzyme